MTIKSTFLVLLALAIVSCTPKYTSESRSSIDKPAEEESAAADDSRILLDFIDDSASFPEGELALNEYISEHLKYPSEAKQNKITGRIIARFVVEKDGSLSNFEIVRGLGYGCDKAVMELLEGMPTWKPALQNDEVVRQRYMLPVHFN